MAGPIKTPISASLVARVSGALRYAVTGQFPDAWFGPGQTMNPVAPPQDVAGRQFDYPVAFNTRYTPRAEETVSFVQMRQLADGCDILRLVIETRKDQMSKLKWKIAPIDPKAAPTPQCEEITTFLRSPDKEHTWDDWLRMVLEDLFVIDAPTLYPRFTNGGQLYSIEPIDGSTIKRVLDTFGRTPLPPLQAYQQILKGMPAVDYTRDELLYKPRNPRTHKIYGYSPVEQIIVTVNMALRRTIHIMEFYKSGSVPDALATVPASWNPDQIKQFQLYWDTLLDDDLAARRKMRFIPDSVKYIPTKDAVLKDEFDEWLARIVCFAFSIAPTPFIKSNNRATAQTSHEQSITEGIVPLQNWLKSLIDSIIQRPDLMNAPDLHFMWDEEEATDPQVQATIQDLRIRNGSMTIDEARAENGDEPLQDKLGSVPLLFTGAAVVTLDSVINPPEPEPEPVGAFDPHTGLPHAAPPVDPNAPKVNPEPGSALESKTPPAKEPAGKVEKKKHSHPSTVTGLL